MTVCKSSLLSKRKSIVIVSAFWLWFTGSMALQHMYGRLSLLRQTSTTTSSDWILIKRTSSTTRLFSSANDSPVTSKDDVSLYRTEGLLAVNKPLEWTSSDVVSYIRGILERDARRRGAAPVKVGSRKNKNKIIKVGHGGTLDPLATGVLVIGIGKGTKELQSYLTGGKRYRAGVELGYETTTLDLEGNITKRLPYDDITLETVESILPDFRGSISQIPPIFSAIMKDGKRLYMQARTGVTAEEIEIDPRVVKIYHLELIKKESNDIPKFEIDVECGGGTYIRALIRDIGYKLGTVATTTYLERTQQGQFKIEEALKKQEWSADSIYSAIDRWNDIRSAEGDE